MAGMVFMALGKILVGLAKAVLWTALQLLRLGLEALNILLLFTGIVLRLFLAVLAAGTC